MINQNDEQLAIQGGKPVRETMLPYGRQFLDDEDIAAVTDVLRSPFLTQGPKIKEFEEAVASYVGAKYAVAFANGTAALHAACYAAGIREGDEVITTPMTFAASANCIRYCGGTVVFADIDPQTYNLDTQLLKQRLTSRTKAVIPVDFTGQPVDLDEIVSFAREHGLIVIEDAAHALGATYKGRKVGALADMTMFSFHPVKHITSGEGGIITTNSEEFYQRMMLFRTHGITRDAEKLVQPSEGPWYYEMLDLGFNYRMTDLQAALGLSQMKKLASFIGRRKEIANRYTEAFRQNDTVIVPFQKEDRESSWHLYVIRLNLDKLRVGRKKVFEALIKENIGVNVHYIPVHLHPYYQRLGYSRGIAPVSEQVYEGIITLPLFPAMTDTDVEDVIQAVNKVTKHYKRID
jgi:perosamine synthetase